jgi:hypothetical protein
MPTWVTHDRALDAVGAGQRTHVIRHGGTVQDVGRVIRFRDGDGAARNRRSLAIHSGRLLGNREPSGNAGIETVSLHECLRIECRPSVTVAAEQTRDRLLLRAGVGTL